MRFANQLGPRGLKQQDAGVLAVAEVLPPREEIAVIARKSRGREARQENQRARERMNKDAKKEEAMKKKKKKKQ